MSTYKRPLPPVGGIFWLIVQPDSGSTWSPVPYEYACAYTAEELARMAIEEIGLTDCVPVGRAWLELVELFEGETSKIIIDYVPGTDLARTYDLRK